MKLTKQEKRVIAAYWALNLVFYVAVFIQDDATAKREAWTWLGISFGIFAVAIAIGWYRRKKGIS